MKSKLEREKRKKKEREREKDRFVCFAVLTSAPNMGGESTGRLSINIFE